MKIHIYLIAIFALASSVLTQVDTEPETSVTTEWRLQGEAPTVTENEVMEKLSCLKDHAVYGPLIQAVGEHYLQTLFYGSMTQNKKYYVMLNDSHRLMYFKEGENVFVHIYLVKEDGSEELMARGFIGDKSIGCVRVLPESCVWKGQTPVTYEQVCTSGLDAAHQIREDLFRISLTEEHDGQISTPEVINAIMDCYRPKCYSVAYECLKKGLYFDFQEAEAFLIQKRDELAAQHYSVSIDYTTMSLKYSRLSYDVEGAHDAQP